MNWLHAAPPDLPNVKWELRHVRSEYWCIVPPPSRWQRFKWWCRGSILRRRHIDAALCDHGAYACNQCDWGGW